MSDFERRPKRKISLAFVFLQDEQLCVAFHFYLTISDRKFFRWVLLVFSEDRLRTANNFVHF